MMKSACNVMKNFPGNAGFAFVFFDVNEKGKPILASLFVVLQTLGSGTLFFTHIAGIVFCWK
jgi:hypothetical protein